MSDYVSLQIPVFFTPPKPDSLPRRTCANKEGQCMFASIAGVPMCHWSKPVEVFREDYIGFTIPHDNCPLIDLPAKEVL